MTKWAFMIDALYMSKSLEVCTLEEKLSTMKLCETQYARMAKEKKSKNGARKKKRDKNKRSHLDKKKRIPIAS